MTFTEGHEGDPSGMPEQGRPLIGSILSAEKSEESESRRVSSPRFCFDVIEMQIALSALMGNFAGAVGSETFKKINFPFTYTCRRFVWTYCKLCLFSKYIRPDIKAAKKLYFSGKVKSTQIF